MGKIKEFLDSKNYLRILVAIISFFWLIAYLSVKEFINVNVISVMESIVVLFIGLSGCFVLSFFKNTFLIVPLIIFTPFVFARPFDIYSAPITLYISLVLLTIGLIVNLIRFKPKLKFGIFLLGLSILGLAMTLGGITIKSDFLFVQIMAMGLISILFIFVYIYLFSTISINFLEIARLMTYLGMFLLFQLGIYYLTQDDFFTSLLYKGADVGWGISNNIALMLLFTFPFTVYLSITNTKYRTVLYMILAVMQLLGIIFTYSRGSVIAMILGVILLLPLSIWKAKDRKTLVITVCSIISFLLILFFGVFIFNRTASDQFIAEAFKIDWDSLNGRMPIYERVLESLKQYPIFGKGVFSLFSPTEATYEWGHSTILQTAETMGLFGIAALIFHMVQKYLYLFKEISLWKVITIFGLFLSDLYGLFDVSYYFINYMVVLIIVLCMVDKLLITNPLSKSENQIIDNGEQNENI